MNPFFEDYKKSLKGAPTSPAALAMAALVGDWFFKYGQQVQGDRQTVARLEARIKTLESKLFKLENKDGCA